MPISRSFHCFCEFACSWATLKLPTSHSSKAEGALDSSLTDDSEERPKEDAYETELSSVFLLSQTTRTMKVLLHYEDNESTDLHKSLKITLPKSWKTGPTSKLLGQFVESYNANETLGSANPLSLDNMHLAIRQHERSNNDKSQLVPLASDAVTIECIPDRADVYIMHGASKTVDEYQQEERLAQQRQQEELQNTVACTRFGCKNRFPRGGPYPDCCYHTSPPVFHETAKFWSCCPNKKAYDWDDFQNIKGCQTGQCTEVKESDGPQFLGGTDLREQAGEAAQLKSIDDFNKAQAAGGADAAPVLERLGAVLGDLGVEKELYNQVTEGIKAKLSSQYASEAELLEAVKADLGEKLKSSMKAIAAEQLRLK